MAQCKAQAKSTGQQCTRQAVTGKTVCTVHGAGTLKRVEEGTRNPAGRPSAQSRYNLEKRADIGAKAAAFMADARPGDLTAELAYMRALFEYHLDNAEELTGHEVERLIGMLATISGTVERVARILAKSALTQAELAFIQASIGDLINRYIDDPAKRAAFVAELRQLTQSHDRD